MPKAIDYVGGIAVFLTGMAAGVLTLGAKPRSVQKYAPAEGAAAGAEPAAVPNPDSMRALGELENRLAAQEAATAERLGLLESRLDDCAVRLEQTPSLEQMESRLVSQEAFVTERFGLMEAVLEEHAAKLAEVPAMGAIESRLEAEEAAAAQRFEEIQTRLDEYAARLADVPSTSQIVSAMQDLLSRTMASLDERLTTQAHSIQVLTTTVSQTDNLLEKVLESLDTLQTPSDSPGKESGPAIQNVSIQRAGELPQSVRSSVEYLLGRPIGPEEQVSIASLPPQHAAR